MSDQPARRVSRRGRRDTRSELQGRLSAALEDLVADGQTYSGLSVELLVDRAGIARSTFYKYFGDKRGLLLALSDEVQADFLAAAAVLLDLPPEATREDYRAAFRAVFAGYRRHRVAMWSLSEEARHDPAVAERFGRMMDGFVEAIAAHIGRVWSGRDDGNPGTVAVWLTWMLEDGQARFVARADEAALERHLAAAAEIVWRAVHIEAP
ncbi:TetR/AcrR family transcriptional regulator [Pseudonocardia sp. RS010]|uniref:TetR/AcrR family transcriptional regulator n=1 Tax=Pseudonocardia sp. RS010 TaxID=3385979 RepID=UPI0039A07AB3